MNSRKQLSLTTTILMIVMIMAVLFPAAVSAKKVKTLKVGCLTNLEWPLGMYFKKFLESYVDVYNQKHPLVINGQQYAIKPILYNTKMNNEIGKAAAERLIYRDGVKFILGGETVDAWMSVAEKEKVLTIATSPSPAVLSPDLKYVFQSSVLTTQSIVLWGWFNENFPDVKTVITAYPDTMNGHNEDKNIKRFADTFGWKKEKSIFYAPTATDFGSIATRIVRSNADVFSTAAGGPIQDSLLFKALHEAGFKGKLFSQSTIPLAEIAKVIPLSTIEGMISASCGIHIDTPPAMGQEYKDAYTTKYGKWDQPDSLHSDVFLFLMAALEQAQSLDVDKVADTIARGMKFSALGGPAMTVSHPEIGNKRATDTLYQAYVRKVVDGKAELIDTVPLEEGLSYLKKFYGWQ